MKEIPIALFDMDGTLADYDSQLLYDLKRIASPGEPSIDITKIHYDTGGYIEARRHIITSQTGWWLNLKKFQLGFDILDLCKKIGFNVVICTKGPSTKFSAWSEKVEWCNKHLKDRIQGVTITNDKSMVYGKVLVDDYPDYILAWLKHRPRSLVIMPAHDFNNGFSHPNVIRYDGTNAVEVEERLRFHFNR